MLKESGFSRTCCKAILTIHTYPSAEWKRVALLQMLMSILVVFWLAALALMVASFVYDENFGP